MSKEFKTSGNRPRRSFMEEFKRAAAHRVAVEGYSFNRAAQAVGVRSNSLRGWYKKYAPEPEAHVSAASRREQAAAEETPGSRNGTRNPKKNNGVLCEGVAVPLFVLETGRLDETTTRLAFGDRHVSYSRRVKKRFLQMAEGHAEPACSAQRTYSCGGA